MNNAIKDTINLMLSTVAEYGGMVEEELLEAVLGWDGDLFDAAIEVRTVRYPSYENGTGD